MTFAWPHLLWLLLLPAFLLAWELSRGGARVDAASHPKIPVAEAGSRHISLAPPRARSSRSRPWLCVGLAFALVALARPQWGRLEEPVFDQAREILIAIDLSRSMLTPDIRPSRLDRAKLLTQALLERLTGERVGLVVFSGTAFLQSPLSSDYEILREFLPSLDPDFLPEGGTNYEALIDTSIAAFGDTTAADRFLIVLSDGEATEDEWRGRVDALKTKGVRVIALGVGTATGALIPDGKGGLVKDERGAAVLSRLEGHTLRELAEKTNGVYQDASTWIDLAGLINSTVEAGRKGKFTEKNTVRLVERFQWPLAFALWCLLVSAYYELPVRPRPREIKLAGGSTPTPVQPAVAARTTALLLLVLLALAGPLGSHASAQSAPKPTPPAPPLLSRIVGRLSTADARSARDWAEMSRETVTWGTRLQSSQQPVPEGPVRDALAAVDLGEQLDPRTADWSKIRTDLEALLKKPDDPQQPPPQQQQQQDQQDQQQKQQDQQQKQQDQQQKDQQQNKDQQQSQPQSKDSPSQNPQQEQQKSEQQQEKKENQSAFGDMKEHAQPPPPETQKVGGVPEQQKGQREADPAMAMPMQKLEQLRNQDSPAELFKLMEADKDKTPRTTTKDW